MVPLATQLKRGIVIDADIASKSGIADIYAIMSVVVTTDCEGAIKAFAQDHFSSAAGWDFYFG